jgi:SAM-dependent methyltransferase
VIGNFLTRALNHAAIYLILQRATGADRLRRLCVEVLRPRAGERFLDIGCGPAYLLDYLPDVTYVGFDTEPRYIAYARRHYGARATFYCEAFTEAHASGLPPFDAVLLMGILHHLSDGEAGALLGRIGRVLRRGGRVISLDPCFDRDSSRIAHVVAALDRGRFVRDERGYENLVRPYFARVDSHVVHNVGRLPSTEIVMHITEPAARLGGAGGRRGP